MKRKSAAVGIVAVLVACALTWYLYHSSQRVSQYTDVNKGRVLQPHSFAECVAAGNAVMESFPRQCTAGKYTFVEPQTENGSGDASSVTIDSVRAQDFITSPLIVSGKAPGSWFFEAVIGLRVLDVEGVEIARGSARATGDWMTEGLVPFTGTIEFTPPTAMSGYLEIQKDNSSGKPELDASVRIPVRFTR